jgi:hypothetical protein
MGSVVHGKCSPYVTLPIGTFTRTRLGIYIMADSALVPITTSAHYDAHAILFFILVTFACGQNVVISYPPPGTKVKPGKHFRVQIARPVRSIVVSDSDECTLSFFRTLLAARWRSASASPLHLAQPVLASLLKISWAMFYTMEHTSRFSSKAVSRSFRTFR